MTSKFLCTLGVTVTLFFMVGTASARDAECEIDANGIVLVDAVPSGGFNYCSPRKTDTGVELPDTGYPMTCEVFKPATTNLPAVILQTTVDVGPAQNIEFLCPDCLFEYQLQLSCTNEAGKGGVLDITARFRPEAPGQPVLP
jgi:hypothetical protein